MLGFVGFSVAALVLVLYAFSSYKLAAKSKEFDTENYYFAYLVMAFAMAVWALATQLENEQLKKAVVFGDVLLLTSTVLLTRVITPKKYVNWASLLVTVLGAGAVYYRSMHVDSIIKDGVLIFYTPRVFGAIVAAALLIIWLKANTNFYNHVILKHKGSETLKYNYFSANVLGYISVCAFLMARKSITVIYAFSLLILSFLILLMLNLYVQNLATRKVAHARRK